MTRPSDLVVEGLGTILEKGQPADRVLDQLLRRHRDLASADRADVARRLLGITCLHRRLDHRLEHACPGWRASPHAFRVAAYVLLEERRSLADAALHSGLAEEELARLEGAAHWPEDPLASFSVRHSLPDWLAARLLADLGPEAEALAESFNRPGPVVLRANLLRTDRDGLRAALEREGVACVPTVRSPWGVRLAGRANLFGLQAWRDGLFEVQDEGSQELARAVDPRPHERVLDFCAGAGGKTLALAAVMRDQGELVALDVDPLRLVNLAARVRRAGVSCVRTHRIDEQGPLPWLGGFDRVLVDAPCSCLGTLRRSPDLRWRLRPEEIPEFAARSLEILLRAGAHVRPGGLLVYATCTLSREENEDVAAAFSSQHPDWRATPLLGEQPLRLLPHLHGTDGFFACAWTRRG